MLASRNVGGGGGHRSPTIKHFSVSLSFLKSEGPEEKPSPCISPSKYKPPPPGACTWKIDLKFKVNQSKTGKFTSNKRASPIDFETQVSLDR